MAMQEDREAYILARQMNFCNTDSVRYEADSNFNSSSRTMNLADWRDSTNIKIKYAPADLPPPI